MNHLLTHNQLMVMMETIRLSQSPLGSALSAAGLGIIIGALKIIIIKIIIIMMITMNLRREMMEVSSYNKEAAILWIRTPES